MTGWGSPERAGRGGDPTIPLPVGDVAAPYGPPGYPDPAVHPGHYRLPESGPPRPKRRRRGRRLIRRAAGAIVALVLLAVMVFGGLLLVTPSAGQAEQLARAQDQAHHAAYPGPPVPARFADALTATEDHRFYSEPGIDLLAVARVAVSYATGQGDQGGATLYQQLAKMLYTPGRSGVTTEAEQVALAVKLYLTYSRPQILQMYADVAYFGNGYYGLQAASCGYFGVPPADLSWPQAALMAGLVQGPSEDDPLTHPGNARAREVHVIGRLVAIGKLTQAQANAALAAPVTSLVTVSRRGCSS
jgi:membrane peptidoglycan carboxypeptidase